MRYDPTAYMQKGIETKKRSFCKYFLDMLHDPTAYMQKGIETLTLLQLFPFSILFMTRPHICKRGLKQVFFFLSTASEGRYDPTAYMQKGIETISNAPKNTFEASV